MIYAGYRERFLVFKKLAPDGSGDFSCSKNASDFCSLKTWRLYPSLCFPLYCISLPSVRPGSCFANRPLFCAILFCNNKEEQISHHAITVSLAGRSIKRALRLTPRGQTICELTPWRRRAIWAMIAGGLEEGVGIILLMLPVPHWMASTIGLDGGAWALAGLTAVAVIDSRMPLFPDSEEER